MDAGYEITAVVFCEHAQAGLPTEGRTKEGLSSKVLTAEDGTAVHGVVLAVGFESGQIMMAVCNLLFCQLYPIFHNLIFPVFPVEIM